MKKYSVLIMLSALLFLRSVSLWQDDSFFRLQLKPGDIIQVQFREKNVLKFENSLKTSDNQNLQGKVVSGEAWGFIPLTAITENDSIASKSELTLRQEKELSFPVRVSAMTNRIIYLQGNHSSLVNGEMLELVLKGRTDINRINSDLSVMSHHIYGLDFEINSRPKQDDPLFRMDDLIFETNYTDIVSNAVVTGNTTNIQVRTNNSSLTLKFKSVQDDRKKELVLYYLNAIIRNLFY